MKRTASLILALMFLFTGASFGAQAKYRAFTPTGAGKSVFLKSGAKMRKYFVVEKGTTLGFDVAGPTTVKIRTRAEFKPGTGDIGYEIQAWEGDRLVGGRKVKTLTSKLVLSGQSVGIGNARTIVLKVPKGRHSYRLWLTSDKVDRYYIRFYQARKIVKKVEFVSYKPYAFSRQVNLNAGKTNTAYYVVDGNGGATVNIVGPTTLQIYCRANFNKDVKGSSKYTLGVFEDGNKMAVFEGVGNAAPAAQFLELADMLPSNLKKFNFRVPAGKHVYEMKKVNSAAPSLSVRFKIPKDGLGMKP